MKSLILELEEDLTDQQIDKIIRKLEAKKKSKIMIEKPAVPKITLTKEEKQLLIKIEHITSEGYVDTTEDYDKPNDFFGGVVGQIKEALKQYQESIDDGINDEENEILNLEEDISDLKKKIKDYENDIKLFKQEIIGHGKGQKEVDRGYELLKKLEQVFKKRKK
jgi:gas vesicle protein